MIREEFLGPGEEEEELYHETTTPEHLAHIRKAIGRPDYQYDSSVNPLHDCWTDDQVVILGPIFEVAKPESDPPSLDGIRQIMDQHPVRAARPCTEGSSISCYHEALVTITEYCRKHGRLHRNPSWTVLAIQLARAHDLRDNLALLRNDEDLIQLTPLTHTSA